MTMPEQDDLLDPMVRSDDDIDAMIASTLEQLEAMRIAWARDWGSHTSEVISEQTRRHLDESREHLVWLYRNWAVERSLGRR
jgi:hypothetical protein